LSRADRPLLLALLAVAVSAMAVLLGPLMLRAFLAPLAGGTWLLVRALVLSVDQAALWSFLLLCGGTLLACRLIGAAASAAPAAKSEAEEPNSALSDIESWRYLFAEAPRGPRERAFARRELSALLCAAYAARFGVRNDYRLYSSFRDGGIPLPGAARAFLFAEEDAEAARRPARRAAAWLRRASGREREDYLGAVEGLLDYIDGGMETSDGR
jgi:hypothetical protein